MARRTSKVWEISKESFLTIVSNSTSFTQIANVINGDSALPSGGTIKSIKNRIKEEEVDITHIPMGRDHKSKRPKKTYFDILTKPCSKCGVVKDISDFAVRKISTGQHSTECKDCHKKVRDLYYLNNKDVEQKRVKDRVKALRVQIRDLKHTLSCEICKEDHYACLQFHHINPKEKEMAISLTANLGWSFKRIEKEMAKCRVLCANCHFKLHYEENKNA